MNPPLRHIDVLRRLQRRQRWLLAIATPMLAGLTTWAFMPLHAVIPDAPALQVRQSTDQRTQNSAPEIEPEVFAVTLWNPPPPPTAAVEVAVQPPPKPLNIQLIGIITEGDIAKAALYDADNDRLLIIADGDQLRGHVVHIQGEGTEGIVELKDGQTTRRLALRPEKGGSS